MVGSHHQLNGREFEQAPGDGEGQGSLVCCIPWGHKELDTTEQQDWQKNATSVLHIQIASLNYSSFNKILTLKGSWRISFFSTDTKSCHIVLLAPRLLEYDSIFSEDEYSTFIQSLAAPTMC